MSTKPTEPTPGMHAMSFEELSAVQGGTPNLGGLVKSVAGAIAGGASGALDGIVGFGKPATGPVSELLDAIHNNPGPPSKPRPL